MNAATMTKACVLGSGTMGLGIAQVLAQSGLETRMYDVAQSALDKGLASVLGNLDKGVEKGKLDAGARDRALSLLSCTTDLGAAIRGVELVVEAVPEKLELKRKLFG